MKQSLVIFINRKLISIDAILPLLCEIKNISVELTIKVVCPDLSTKVAIDNNIFIKEQIDSIGNIYVLSIRNSNNKRSFFNIMKTIILLFSFFKDCIFSRTSFIHFGLLFKKPFNFLNYINKNKSYYCENDPYGFTQLMQDVTFLKKNYPINYPLIKSGNVIAFSKVWNIDKNNEYKYFYYGPSRKRKFWINLVLSKSEYYLEKELTINRLDKNSTLISIMLGYFGELKYLSNKDSVMNSLDDTIKILSQHIKEEVVVFKPHVFTDLIILEKILKKYKDFNYIITNLHPMILATRSKFAIANYYSTTLSDFNTLGVKTIEYTDYCPEALSLTSGGSLRPEKIDYFINKDLLYLSDTVKKLLKTENNLKYNYNNTNVENLFSALNGKKL
jgi:hypothetical protein